jgi:hypothetical protein
MLDIKKFIEEVNTSFVGAISPILKRLDTLEKQSPKDGEKGDPGKDGRNAYEVAVSLGYTGSVYDWMESLRGKNGENGKDGKDGREGKDGRDGRDGINGKDGINGVDGKNGEPGAPGKDGADGINGKDGKDGLPGKDGKDGRDGLDGKDVDPEQIQRMVSEEIAKLLPALVKAAVEAIPKPKDGIDGKDGKDGRDGIDGKDADPEEFKQLINKLFAEIPKPKDGASVTLQEVTPLITSQIAKIFSEFEKPKDGRDGKDGINGKDGVNGRDGRDGKDGRDAFDLEDFECSISDDERMLTLAWARGNVRVEKQIRLSHAIYKGVWSAGDFLKGDMVTFGGSVFVAKRDTNSRPESDDSWQLCVKRGRDGKDGKDAIEKKPVKV